MRAERRLGELLADDGERRGGISKSHDGTSIKGGAKPLPEGVSKQQSHRWQQVASVPEAAFESHLQEAKDAAQRAMVADKMRDWYENEAKERQRLSEGRGKKGQVNLPGLKEGRGQARDLAGKAAGVSGKSIDHATHVRKCYACYDSDTLRKTPAGVPAGRRLRDGGTAGASYVALTLARFGLIAAL